VAWAAAPFCRLVRLREIKISIVVPIMVPHPVAQGEIGSGLVADYLPSSGSIVSRSQSVGCFRRQR
jgi:hypothetical protein